MKNLLKEKADRLIDKHFEKYQNRHGESFKETKQYTHIEHLINISNYGKGGITPFHLNPTQENIISAYYGVNNDHSFNSILIDYILKLADDANNIYGKSQQNAALLNGLIPIIHKIAYDSFIGAGIQAVLSKQEFEYI